MNNSTNNTFFSEFYSNFENKKREDTSIIGIGVDSSIDNSYFGILKLNAISANITQNNIDFVFIIDQSRSMNDKCSDGKNKMDHILYTLKNMFIYFKKLSSNNIFITIFAFDNYFDEICSRAQILTDDDLNLLLDKIETIHPRGSTDIENAFIKTSEYIDQLKEKYPNNSIHNIFMTDGQATTGSTVRGDLKKLIDNTISNYFIGFGLDHDASLLNFFSNDKNSNYYFIDVIEKSGLVYGEILNDIFYKLLTDVCVFVENGHIYDYKNNIWVKELYIGNIVGESNKIYHLLSNSPDECNVYIKANNNNTNTNNNEIICIYVNKLLNDNIDYTNYIFRQKTLQLLFEIYDYQKRSFQDKSNLKIKLKDLLAEIKQYMTDHNLSDDKFLKNLCDDIYISYKTLGSKYGAMYSCARQTSQGTQRCYTVTQTPDLDIKNHLFPSLVRSTRDNYFDDNTDVFTRLSLPSLDDNDDNDILLHHTSDFDDMPYLTPTATQLMREISGMYNTSNTTLVREYKEPDSQEETQRY